MATNSRLLVAHPTHPCVLEGHFEDVDRTTPLLLFLLSVSSLSLSLSLSLSQTKATHLLLITPKCKHTYIHVMKKKSL